MPPKPMSIRPTTSFKRSRSQLRSASTTPVPSSPNVISDRYQEDLSLPAFLRQSNADIRAKFEDLAWQQKIRIAKSRTEGDPEAIWGPESTVETRARNRYVDVWPWANLRIRLRVPEGVCDYINASPITVCCSKTGMERKYIAAQGPKDTGLDHFWQMVWHETKETAVIVMLTQLHEGLREKCHQYYPDDEESEPLEVTITDETGEEHLVKVNLTETTYDEGSKTTIRKLLMTAGEESKVVWHLFFLGWPDFGVPEDEDRSALLALLKLSREKNLAWDHPRIIHCSAGVGRSGTFIALECLLEELENGVFETAGESDDPIAETVSKLREQRMTMVQSDAQFQVLYDLVRDEFRKRQKQSTSRPQPPPPSPSLAANKDLATEKLPSAGGEPSPKVMRLSSIRAVFLRDKAKALRASASLERLGPEGKAPVTP